MAWRHDAGTGPTAITPDSRAKPGGMLAATGIAFRKAPLDFTQRPAPLRFLSPAMISARSKSVWPRSLIADWAIVTGTGAWSGMEPGLTAGGRAQKAC